MNENLCTSRFVRVYEESPEGNAPEDKEFIAELTRDSTTNHLGTGDTPEDALLSLRAELRISIDEIDDAILELQP